MIFRLISIAAELIKIMHACSIPQRISFGIIHLFYNPTSLSSFDSFSTNERSLPILLVPSLDEDDNKNCITAALPLVHLVSKYFNVYP